MTTGKSILEPSYRRKLTSSTPALQIGVYNSAIMRALAPFPEASRAVIAELDRLESRAK
jgi:hypothetical protein